MLCRRASSILPWLKQGHIPCASRTFQRHISDAYPLEENPAVLTWQDKPIRIKPWTHTTGAQAEWLAQTQEDILEPDLPIIDPHHHLFIDQDPQSLMYRQSHPNFARYMAEEFAADLNAGHNIIATVYTTAYTMYRYSGPAHLKCVGESEFAQGIAAIGNSGYLGKCKMCAGIVATAPTDVSPELAAEVLDAHTSAARNFRGIRFASGRVEGTPWQDSDFQKTLALMSEGGLVLDVNGPETFPLDFSGVLSSIAEVAKSFPDLSIVVDHCGGLVGPLAFPPGDAGAKELAVWKKCIDRLASHRNVNMKLGGLVMPVSGYGFEHRKQPPGSEELAEHLKPYVEYCLDRFGPQRCMFESNFPMDKCSVSYAVYWNAYKRIAKNRGMNAQDKQAVFFGTASRVYKLALDEEM